MLSSSGIHEVLPRWGQSATQLYTYAVFLWRTPIMLTTNTWDYSEYSAPDKDWIGANCVEVHIGAPVWRSGETPPESPRPAGEALAAQRVGSPAGGSRPRRPAAAMEAGPSPEHKRACAP